MEQLHLTGIDINFDEKSTSFTLGNKYDRSDLKALYEDALGQNSKSFNELKYITSIVEDQQKYYKRDWAAELRTITLDNVLTSEDQSIEINNRGLIGRKRQVNEDGSWKSDESGNPLFDSEQVKLINNTLVFTNDNWQTAATAVGKIAVGYDDKGDIKYAYGINGQVLIGELILGNNLVLTGTGAGVKIKDSNGNDAFYADENGNLVLSGTIYANEGQIANWIIDSNKIYRPTTFATGSATVTICGSGMAAVEISDDDKPVFYAGYSGQDSPFDNDNWISSTQFWVNTKGQLYTKDIIATGGKIGGWKITNAILGNEAITNIIDANSVGIAPGINTKTGTISSETADGEKNGLCFWAGAIHSDNSEDINSVNISTAPFRVYSDGSLYASNANVTGSIHIDINKDNGLYLEDSSRGFTSSIFQKSDNNRPHVQWTLYGAEFHMWSHTDGLSPSARLNVDDFYVAGNVWPNNGRSDKRVKYDISSFSEPYEILFDNLRPCCYKYINGTSGRVHTGYIAQEVVEAVEAVGLTTKDFAAVILSEPNTENEMWYLRRDEFVALNTWQIQRCKKRIAELETTVAELKTQIQALTAG